MTGRSTSGRVLVAGSINMDVVVTATHFPKAGETVPGSAVHFFPGGKGANQAVAAAKAGAPTALIGRLGDDDFGRNLRAFLTEQGVDLKHVATTGSAHSGTAVITLADTENTIVVVPGANGLVESSDVSSPSLKEADVLVSQFEIPVAAIAAFFSRGRAMRATTILNPAPIVAFNRDLLDLADIVVLNETELGALTGFDVTESDSIETLTSLARGLRRSRTQVICVTLGKRGAVALANEEVLVIPGRRVTAADTTGAGDCFVGSLAARLAAGADIRSALEYSNVAASICVQRMGAGPSMPSASEVEAARSSA